MLCAKFRERDLLTEKIHLILNIAEVLIGREGDPLRRDDRTGVIGHDQEFQRTGYSGIIVMTAKIIHIPAVRHRVGVYTRIGEQGGFPKQLDMLILPGHRIDTHFFTSLLFDMLHH